MPKPLDWPEKDTTTTDERSFDKGLRKAGLAIWDLKPEKKK